MTSAVLERPDAIETTAVAIGKIDYGILREDLQAKVNADLAMTIDGPDDKAGYKLADTRRKEWVRVRTGIDKTRKDLNAEAKRHIDKVNSVAKELTDIAAQAEDHVTKLVDDIDAAIEKKRRDEIDAVFNARNEKLLAAGVTLPRILVDSMSDIEIEDKIAEAVELARFRKEEAERMAKEKADADRIAAELAEKNRIDAENLKAEREAFEKQQDEAKAEAERVAKIESDKVAAERAETARLKKIDDDKRDSERAEFEKQKAELAAAQKKLDDEKAEAARIESERLAAIERERLAAIQREKDRTESEERAQREAEVAKAKAEQDEADKARAEALRPDKEKLLSVAQKVSSIKVPKVADELLEMVGHIEHLLTRTAREITETINV